MQISKYLKNEFFIIFLYSLVIFLFFFLLPWVKSGTIFFFRWDEAVYLYIHQKIADTGYIPSELNYIGGIKNYIYPEIYTLLSNFLLITTETFDLRYASVALQIILYISLLIGAIATYKIGMLVTKNSRIAFLAGFFFSTSPIVTGRLFYLHATFYANFIGISFLLLFLYYLIKYGISSEKKFLVLSILFYSMTLFTHQLVFMMATVILGISFLLNLIEKKGLMSNIREKLLFVTITVFVNLGYIIKTPILQKILNILGIVHYEEFGKEVVSKTGASNLPPLIPVIFLGIAAISAIFILFKKEYKDFRIIAVFFLFLIISIILQTVNINLPASFRYDTFFITTVPLLVSLFLIKVAKTLFIRGLFVAFLMGVFFLSNIGITNGFFVVWEF